MTTRQMIDSAYPLKTQPQPLCDIVLIYAGGNTPHPWSKAEIAAQPNRYRWPCWVRSHPTLVDAARDAANCVAWLKDHNVPQHTAVILDLETAIDTRYVNTFNLALRAAGYRVTKYGSRSTIWKNPKTDGGTFVAWPGHPNEMDHTGDTVAVQYLFHGDYDKSIVLGQDKLPLWDTKPEGPFRRVVGAGNTQTLTQLATARGVTRDFLAALSRAHLNPENLAIFNAYLTLCDLLKAAGHPEAAMPEGLVYWTRNSP
jgi:hypothetical protein